MLRLLLLAGAAAIFATSASGATSGLHVVATHLNSPRKLFVAPSGVYVVEAGTGGSDRCLGKGANAACVGLSGAITRIAGGPQKRVVTGLFSAAKPTHTSAQGPADVAVRGNTYYVLMQNGVIDARGRNSFGPDGAVAGDLIATPPGKAAPKVIANLATFEAKHNPDHGAGPGARFGNPPLDSDPYAFVPYRGGFAVVDAAANDLLWVSPKGAISVLAVFPTRTQKLTKSVAKQIGATGMTSIVAQSVPSSVVAGPGGALYVGELTGAPFAPGSARVWRVVPGKKPTVYASGFTNISDLAFDGPDLLVLELSAKGLLDRTSPGALIRLTPQGSRQVIASAGLSYPTGLAVSGRTIYISNNGVYPGTGKGPHGEVVSLPA